MKYRQPYLTVAIILIVTIIGFGRSSEFSNSHIDSLINELKLKPDSARVDLLNEIAYNYYYYKPDSTDEYALQSIELATSINYLKGLSEAQRLLGIAYKAQNNQKEAISWLFKGLNTAESINYDQGIADNLNSIGIFFKYIDDYGRAIRYFKRSVKHQIIAKNKLREGILYANLGNIYLEKNDTDSSQFYFSKSMTILDSIGEKPWLAMIYSQYGGLLIKLNDLENAEEYSKVAFDLSQETNQTFHLRKSYQNLAEIYLLKHQIKEAISMGELALEKSLVTGFIPYIIKANEILYKIYKSQNNNTEALKYLEKYAGYQESLREDQVNSEADLLTFQIALEKKELENNLLRQENEDQEARNLARENIIQRQSIIGIGITIILVVVSVLAIILFRLRQKERGTNKKLVHSNKELEEQKEEMSATLQMVEHLNAQLQAQNNALNQSAIVSLTDLEGNIISVNDNFCRVSGYEMEELIGENKRMLKSDEHSRAFFTDLWQTIKSGNNWRGELKNKKKDGDFFWCDTAIAPVFDDDGNPKQFFSLQFEITKRKKYLNEISSKSHELEELNQLKDRLLSIVSHDFRGPLNSLQGTLNLLLGGAITQDEFKMLTHSLVEKLDHTHNLLENLLNWAKSQMQGMKVYPKMVDIKAITDDCVGLLSPIAEKKLVSITSKIDDPIDIFADNEMVKLILRNLLSNAIKFSNARTGIILESTTEDDRVIVSVKDHGLGISNEHQEKIFKYENISTYGTSNEKGMGIGLLLCKDFIERNGGELWFESELGKGSTFYFSLPTKEPTIIENQS